jgi:uncharacterized protein
MLVKRLLHPSTIVPRKYWLSKMAKQTFSTPTDTETASATPASEVKKFRILSLDGGGAKGFYTLGVLKEIEGMIACPLCQRFDLVFGTSTGSIIAALVCMGRSVDDIHELYKEHVPKIMKAKGRSAKSRALIEVGEKVFGEAKFNAMKTDIGIVSTNWMLEVPMIFKSSIRQAHGRTGTFSAGFGCTIADAVAAACSAYPFFDRKQITTDTNSDVELVDGGNRISRRRPISTRTQRGIATMVDAHTAD